MKKLVLSISAFSLLCLGISSLSATATHYKNFIKATTPTEDPSKSKTFSKSFTVTHDDKINLYNKYGSLTIKVWDKKEIKLDAELKAYGLTDDEAQSLLDSIYIDASKTTNLISFKTTINSKNKSWGEGYMNGIKFHKEVKVNMIVYMPALNALTATTSYGNLLLDDFNGATSIKVQHGDFIGGNLNNAENNISVQYGKIDLKEVNNAKIQNQHGKGFTINNINNLNLNAQYSTVDIGSIKNTATIEQQHGGGLTIKEVGILNLSAQYAAVNIGDIKIKANIKQQHGDKLVINNTGDLNLTTQYVDVKLTTLNGNANADLQHGNLKIDEVTVKCKNLKVDASYSDLKLGFNNNYNADFNLGSTYGDFETGFNVTAQNLNEDKNNSRSKRYAGKIGKGSTTSLVNIEAQHSNINFN